MGPQPVSGLELILASASPQRSKLLMEEGVEFRVQPSPLCEPPPPPAVGPRAWGEAMAYFKARAVAEQNPGRWVLGADTVVWCEGQHLGKARNIDDARRMLELQGRSVADVTTGVCLVHISAECRRVLRTALTRVVMRDDAAERERYLATGDWVDKAGAYGIQNLDDRLVEQIEGSFSNVIGLPLELLRAILSDLPSAAGEAAERERRRQPDADRRQTAIDDG